MKRLTMSLDDDLAEAFEAVVRTRGYENRSEAFRDLLRADLGQAQAQANPAAPCIATLSYVYNHHQRQLAMRLTELQHAHHELTVSTMHAHLDHDHCVEVVILRGRVAAVEDFARSVITQPGVSHGRLHVMPLGDPLSQVPRGASPHAHRNKPSATAPSKARTPATPHRHRSG